MKSNKTKLAGIISLLCCTSTMAAVNVTVVSTQTDDSRFGPFVSAASPDASQIATYTQTYAQSFTYDIGAPWTYNEYCLYDSDICEMLWKGTKSDLSDSLYVWRRNISSTSNGYNHTYVSDRVNSINGTEESPASQLTESRHITAVNSDGSVTLGYGTGNAATDRIVRRGFYNNNELKPAFDNNGGFSAAHDFTNVQVTNSDGSVAYQKTVAVGQSSVNWANSDDTARFTYCFNWAISDDRYDYDDLFYCPGFDLQASYWEDPASGDQTAKSFVDGWIDAGGSATYLANAYAINASGFAVGFTTDQIYDSTNGGRSRAALFVPKVESTDKLTYTRTDITKPLTDTGSDYNDIIRDTVVVDITDKVYNDAIKVFDDATGTDAEQAFIVVGNRTFNQPKNRSYATEFFTYNVADGSVRYPLTDTPVKGANSRVTKINNDGLAVGWRDSRGEVNPTYLGSPRFQSAFLYDFKKDKTAYLDDMYCKSQIDAGQPVTLRLSNAISISENDGSGNYTILANAYDYKTTENYKNKTGSTPVVVSMTYSDADFYDATNAAVCPTAENESYERQGAGMGWFLLLPLTILFRRRFSA